MYKNDYFANMVIWFLMCHSVPTYTVLNVLLGSYIYGSKCATRFLYIRFQKK